MLTRVGARQRSERTMPTYDYQCQACGKRFHEQLTVVRHEKHQAQCPKCGSKRVRQQLESFFAITAKKS